jgi:hypothetical protein
MDIVALAIVSMVVAYQLWVSILVIRTSMYEPRQKWLQLIGIWLAPVIGAVVAYSMLGTKGKPSEQDPKTVNRFVALALRGVAKLVGDADALKSAAALGWAWGAGIVVKISCDGIYFLHIYKGPRGAALNASTEALIANVISAFGSLLVAGYIAALLAPAQRLRHAAAAGLPICLGAIGGLLINWEAEPWWNHPSEGLAGLAGAVAGVFLHRMFKGKNANGAT